jgi:hypothetical protein
LKHYYTKGNTYDKNNIFLLLVHLYQIGLGSHIEYPTGTKNSNFVEDHARNIPAKFGSNRPSGFGGVDPMGKCSNAFFSETTNMIKAKLYMNVH